MCEYCGCQSVTAIDELTREHDMVVAMIGEVRTAHAAGDVPQMVGLARRIAAVLGPHGVFPAALTTLSGADWGSVDAVRARAGSLLSTDPAVTTSR